jgi:Flp pilus assembly pilin Flp
MWLWAGAVFGGLFQGWTFEIVSRRKCLLKIIFVFRRLKSMQLAHRLWVEDQGQDIAEYAVMLAVILVIVVGTVRLIGSNANNVFSSVASSIQ